MVVIIFSENEYSNCLDQFSVGKSPKTMVLRKLIHVQRPQTIRILILGPEARLIRSVQMKNCSESWSIIFLMFFFFLSKNFDFWESLSYPFKVPPPGGSQEISQIHNLVISCFYFRGFYHFWSLEYTCECFFINCNAPNGDKSPFPIEIMDKNWGFSSRIRKISWMFYCRQRFRHDKEETRR